jgi:hypothetical protein
MLIEIANNGPAIRSTNYWHTEHGQRGLCYLTGNAGVWRLLVPPAAEPLLAEMRTGRRVSIEPSISSAGLLDIVFDDGTSSPFCLTLDPRQADRAVTAGSTTLAVWTQQGLQLSLPCSVCV